MTRTRAAGHTWTAATITALALAVWTATAASWWCLPALLATGPCAAMAAGCHLKTCKEQRIARRLARLRGTLTAAEEQAWKRLEEQLRKDPA